MTNLSININKIALIRNSRGRNNPDIQAFAERCLELGASGITVHPRPDQRHARNNDLHTLAAMCKSFGREFNVEGYPSTEFLALMREVRPDQCTLVPDAPAQLTSDHGWDMQRDASLLVEALQGLKGNGIRTSLFVDHENPNIGDAKLLGADRVELFTGPYAERVGTLDGSRTLAAYAAAAHAASVAGLGVNAGHDLNLENLANFLTIPDILEISVGHAFVVDCLYVGIDAAMARYRQLATARHVATSSALLSPCKPA